ncbi:hypothetical protein GOODEAATRI_005870 [Goodea atripinnis]|uniref:MHC class I antigen n=1 Tax=Goodea atripinnis TaxID=208336 RepID=A0ABV0PVN2_9TELE
MSRYLCVLMARRDAVRGDAVSPDGVAAWALRAKRWGEERGQKDLHIWNHFRSARALAVKGSTGSFSFHTRHPSAGVRQLKGSPASSQLTVGTWFKLYSLALSRRLAMLLAMFIPWDVLVLEQVGG